LVKRLLVKFWHANLQKCKWFAGGEELLHICDNLAQGEVHRGNVKAFKFIWVWLKLKLNRLDIYVQPSSKEWGILLLAGDISDPKYFAVRHLYLVVIPFCFAWNDLCVQLCFVSKWSQVQHFGNVLVLISFLREKLPRHLFELNIFCLIQDRKSFLVAIKQPVGS
jgi:hypothetical protein